MNLFQAFIITRVVRFLDCSRFIQFVGFILVLFLLVLVSVSKSSSLPGLGPDWNQSESPGTGHNPPSNLTRSVLAGLLPAPDRKQLFFGRFQPGPRLHIMVPATLPPSTYLSSDRIMT
jgi:hypothetical protein